MKRCGATVAAMGPTAVTELFGIRHPVLSAPMARAATPELAAAVSEAGGLGGLGSALLPAEELGRQAAAVRALTDAPFNLNFFVHPTPEIAPELAARASELLAPLYAEDGLGQPPAPSVPPIGFDEERLAALLEIRPAVVSFHFGLPEPAAVAAIRDAGSRVIASATTVAEAVRLQELGADAVIAQGAEAGGHRGSFLVDGDDGPIGTLALVPQVVDAVTVPVIAAGGNRRRQGIGRGPRPRRRRGPDRVRLPRLSGVQRPPRTPGSASERRGRGDPDHEGVHRPTGPRASQRSQRGDRRLRGAPVPGPNLAYRSTRRDRQRACPTDADLARPGGLPGRRATGRRGRRLIGRAGRQSARRPAGGVSAAQLSRLTCEPPTIASLPSAKRTQALLPPS